MKKLIAFLVCFTVLAVGVTYGFIQYTLRAPAGEEPITEAGIDLSGFYDENDLVVTEVREDTEAVYISYPQIDGLKNTEAETAVNDLIRREAQRLIEQDLASGEEIRYLSYNISGNFANTFSVGLYSAHEQVYLNFNLNDGSLLQLRDLFAWDADLQAVVHGAFYDALTRGNLGDGYWEKANSPDENELYKTVKAYLNSENPQFLFTPSEINLYYGNYMATVPMLDYAEDIVIYNKYMTEESLFEQDGIGYDGIFTCADLPRGYERREFGFAADHFWYDIALAEPYVDEQIPADKRESYLAFYDNIFNSLMAEAAGIRDLALTTPDKAYVLLANPTAYLYTDSQQSGDVWLITPSCVAEVNENYMLYEMSAELFESKYRAALTEVYRSNMYNMFYGGLDEYIDGNELQATYRRSYALYNYETGERMTLDDIFADGYDHPTAVRTQMKYDLVSYYGYTMEAAELAVENLWYELSGLGLNVYIPSWSNEQYLYMSLGQFPRVALKIYD